MKKAYKTEEEAFAHLEHIVNTNYNPCKKINKKPCRVFKDPRDGFFYLTSKPDIKIYYVK